MDETGSGAFKSPLSVLEEAERLINGQRSIDYGDAKENHELIAVFWSAWLIKRGVLTRSLDAVEVAILMSLLKHARLANNPEHRDSWVDIAGYTAIAEKILSRPGG